MNQVLIFFRSGSPFHLNATCFDTGKIRIEWMKPSHFLSEVHNYKIYFKDESEATYKSVTYPVDSAPLNDTQYNVRLQHDISNGASHILSLLLARSWKFSDIETLFHQNLCTEFYIKAWE